MAGVISRDYLNALLPDWQALLQGWALDGSLASAAKEALMLEGSPGALQDLMAQWSAGDFRALPPIVLLSSAEMNDAMGAYAISTGTIYLNVEWMEGASKEQVYAVLTEELGHYLDGLLNAVDTPGDEGEYFAAFLQTRQTDREAKVSIISEDGTGLISVDENSIKAEFSSASKWVRYLPYDLEDSFSSGIRGSLRCQIQAVETDSLGNSYYSGNAQRAFQDQHWRILFLQCWRLYCQT